MQRRLPFFDFNAGSSSPSSSKLSTKQTNMNENDTKRSTRVALMFSPSVKLPVLLLIKISI